MFLIIFHISFSSATHFSRTRILNNNQDNNFSSPNDFFNWFFDSGLPNFMNQPEEKHNHEKKFVEDCMTLDPSERDRCYHDMAEKHIKRRPSKVPVFDDNGNLVLFEESPLDDSFEHEESSNHDAKIMKNKIKYKQLENGQKLITVEKEGELPHPHSINMNEKKHISLIDPYDVHISPISAHNVSSIHDESSSELENEHSHLLEPYSKNKQDHNFFDNGNFVKDNFANTSFSKRMIGNNKFRVTGSLKTNKNGARNDLFSSHYQENPPITTSSSSRKGTYFYSFY